MFIREVSDIDEVRRVVGITVFLETDCKGKELILKSARWDFLGQRHGCLLKKAACRNNLWAKP